MRYPASEKLEIIRLVEESHVSARRALAKLGIPRTTFYRPLSSIAMQSTAGQWDMIDIYSAAKLVFRISRLGQSTSGTGSPPR